MAARFRNSRDWRLVRCPRAKSRMVPPGRQSSDRSCGSLLVCRAADDMPRITYSVRRYAASREDRVNRRAPPPAPGALVAAADGHVYHHTAGGFVFPNSQRIPRALRAGWHLARRDWNRQKSPRCAASRLCLSDGVNGSRKEHREQRQPAGRCCRRKQTTHSRRQLRRVSRAPQGSD